MGGTTVAFARVMMGHHRALDVDAGKLRVYAGADSGELSGARREAGGAH